jgi:hypothetical protein
MSRKSSADFENDQKLIDALRSTFDEAYPNPLRRGCPPPSEIRNLAWQRRISNINELLTHLTQCSECSREHTRLRRQYKHRRVLLGMAAALFLLVGITYLSVHIFRSRQEAGVQQGQPVPQANPPIVKSPPPNQSQPPVQEFPPKELQVVLDLRKGSVSRGENASKTGDINLPRGRLKLSIYLPIGSEEGGYEILLSGKQEGPALTVKGTAKMQGHLNILEVRLDTSTLRAGRYSLAFRQAGWEWTQYSGGIVIR